LTTTLSVVSTTGITVEPELFLDSKSGVFGLADSRLRDVQKLNRLYLVVAIALLYGTMMGITVQLFGLRQQVDIHYSRGLSYLKIDLRWLRGTIHKGRELPELLPLPYCAPERCFASCRAQRRKPLSRLAAVCPEWGCTDYYEELLFSRIRSLHCAV